MDIDKMDLEKSLNNLFFFNNYILEKKFRLISLSI